jgi:hypothetical protein
VNNTVPIEKVLEDASDNWGPSSYKLLCPTCSYMYQQTGTPTSVDREGPGGWDGKQDMRIVPIIGECGHTWEFCFGFHKGETFFFVRTTTRPAET